METLIKLTTWLAYDMGGVKTSKNLYRSCLVTCSFDASNGAGNKEAQLRIADCAACVYLLTGQIDASLAKM